MGAIELIKSDLFRYAGTTSSKSFIKTYVKEAGFRFSVAYGLYIGHGGPVIINPTAVIGNNCNLSQFVTIGAIDGNAAEIGDNVYIGPNCCLIENVRIGNNVTIGSGSVVTHDIPDNATVAGNYAKVLNYDRPGKYVENRWNETGN